MCRIDAITERERYRSITWTWLSIRGTCKLLGQLRKLIMQGMEFPKSKYKILKEITSAGITKLEFDEMSRERISKY